jgi:hypothetical protein
MIDSTLPILSAGCPLVPFSAIVRPAYRPESLSGTAKKAVPETWMAARGPHVKRAGAT